MTLDPKILSKTAAVVFEIYFTPRDVAGWKVNVRQCRNSKLESVHRFKTITAAMVYMDNHMRERDVL